jgi:hypothetical protein
MAFKIPAMEVETWERRSPWPFTFPLKGFPSLGYNKLDEKKAEELKKKIAELNIPRLKPEQIVKLIDKYGLGTVKACMKEMMDAGERAARAAWRRTSQAGRWLALSRRPTRIPGRASLTH